jgi:MFS family permease
MTYLEILRLPRVALLVATTLVARLPVGMNPLAVVLLMHDEAGSFGDAGLVAGTMAVGTAVSQPFLSRLVDARGNAVMIPMDAGQVVSVAGLLASARSGAPIAVAAAFALLNGMTLAPTSSVLRATWPRLLGDRKDMLVGAYAMDSVLIQLSFLTGPLLVTALVAVASVDVALIMSAVGSLAGTVAFVVAAGPNGKRRGVRAGRLLGPLHEPAIWTLVVSQVPIGIAYGSMQVILPAFADSEGHTAQAGLLLALFSLASTAGALVYGTRPRRRPLDDVHVRLAMVVPAGLATVLWAWSIPSMAVLVLPAGAVLSAFFSTRNELAGTAAPAGARTEAVTWPLTALIAGNSVGIALTGALAQDAGWRTAMTTSVVSAAVGAILVRARRESLRPARAEAVSA